jgi:hypothetical protein
VVADITSTFTEELPTMQQDLLKALFLFGSAAFKWSTGCLLQSIAT